ncbi:MAG: hypothetical protein ICV85_00940 [Tolypothrix sp. T3-bin4]|nr:hypothetical protein [Tolypothrix sp. T3-bin4]
MRSHAQQLRNPCISQPTLAYLLKWNGTDLSPELKYPTLREPLRGTGTLRLKRSYRASGTG